ELSKAKVRGGAHGKYFQHVSSTRKRKSSDRKKIESGLIKVNNNGEDDHVKRSRSSRVIKRPARFGSFANPDNLTAFIDDSVTEGNVDDGTSSTENHSPGTAMVLAYIDDDAADEDYRETPIHKQKTRMFTFNEAPIVSKMNDVNDEEQAPLKKKSKSNAGSCNCKKGRCASHLCGCVKRNSLCVDSCTCSSNLCENRTMKSVGIKVENENMAT
uniref:CRC domain-containing protein n=1 Tax=Romanomermis culicivorax TaxID=13658 RepID=A0A915JFR5_ROMCU